MRKMTFEVYLSKLLSSVRVGGVAQAFALAQESATCNRQICIVVFSHVAIRVKQLLHWTPLRTPQSHDDEFDGCDGIVFVYFPCLF